MPNNNQSQVPTSLGQTAPTSQSPTQIKQELKQKIKLEPNSGKGEAMESTDGHGSGKLKTEMEIKMEVKEEGKEGDKMEIKTEIKTEPLDTSSEIGTGLKHEPAERGGKGSSGDLWGKDAHASKGKQMDVGPSNGSHTPMDTSLQEKIEPAPTPPAPSTTSSTSTMKPTKRRK